MYYYSEVWSSRVKRGYNRLESLNFSSLLQCSIVCGSQWVLYGVDYFPSSSFPIENSKQRGNYPSGKLSYGSFSTGYL